MQILGITKNVKGNEIQSDIHIYDIYIYEWLKYNLMYVICVLSPFLNLHIKHI